MIDVIKKMTLAFVVLSVSDIASAAMYQAPPVAVASAPTAKNGFYAGIGLGGLALHETLSGSGTTTFEDGASSGGASTTNAGSATELNSTLLAGYAWSLPHQIFLGVEAFGNYTNASIFGSSSQTNTDADGMTVESEGSGDYTLHYMYGVRALPGYQIKPDVVVYGIVGYSRAHVDVNANPVTVTVDSSDKTIIPGSSSAYNFNGYQLGLGAMIDITEHVAIRGDVIYTGYQSQTSQSTEVVGDSIISGSSTLGFSTLEADFSLIYRFD